MMNRNLATLVAVIALIAFACGGGSAADEKTTTTIAAAATTQDLPPNPAGACSADEPACDDVAGNEPPILDDEPDTGVQPGGSSGMLVDGGLTVAEALTTDAVGIIAVTGFIVVNDSGAHLCELLAESLPPLCGGAAIEVADLSTIDPDSLSEAQGVTWTDQPVTILGEIVDGTLVPDPFSI